MHPSFKLSRRIARLRAPVFAAVVAGLIGCDGSDSLNPETSTPPLVDEIASADPISQIEEDSPIGEEDAYINEAAPVGAPTLASASFAGGIPFGTFALPTSWFGNTYNGAMRTNSPNVLLSELNGIKSKGGKVVLMFAGNEKYYKDANGNFSFTKWKERVNRFKGINFSSYISDGTVIGHYLIDEPNDPANWNGKPVPPSTLEEMARYSKSLWPGMTTIVRVEPSYLAKNHSALDAAWAQYLARRGNVNDYIRRVVNEAQDRGVGLVVGLNVLRGGHPNGTQMSATEVKEWGSALLSSSYPCAFISWTYNSTYLNQSSIESAMATLRNKAESRSARSCKG